ncbi:MAG: hypothetical protein WCE58_13335 [Gallionella sp.]
MNHNWARAILMLLGSIGASSAHAAVDSYRFVHVTIATPWYIFLFLLMGVFAPFVLMVVLAWRNAVRKSELEADDGHQPSVK